MSDTITVPSHFIAPIAAQRLTPAMTSALWEIAAALDEKRVSPESETGYWLIMPSSRLRGSGRNDNFWLRQCLKRFHHIEIEGENSAGPWSAVILAQAQFSAGGTIVELLIPPAAIRALRSPDTFAKIEREAAHRLRGPARRLYGILADKKRMKRNHWDFSLDELRSFLQVNDRSSYQRWQDLKRWVLEPAVKAINDFGSVDVKMEPMKEGRSISQVRFTWKWKDPNDALATSAENDRHSTSRGQTSPAPVEAPPLLVDLRQEDPAKEWWGLLDDEARSIWSDFVGRYVDSAGTVTRRERDIVKDAFENWSAGREPKALQENFGSSENSQYDTNVDFRRENKES